MQLYPFQDANGLLQSVPMPDLVLLRQRFPRPRILDIHNAMYSTLNRVGIATRLRPGMRIAISVGSRGIADIASITRALERVPRQHDSAPFIVPAMGSKGGETAEGK